MTPTARATWLADGLLHHALVQPYDENNALCDVLTACNGFHRKATVKQLRPMDAVVSCLTCLTTQWEATVAREEVQGRLTDHKYLETDTVLHRILMKSGALAPSALQDSRR